jgi:hypothetical protein
MLNPIRFGGEAERQAYLQRIGAFPKESLEKLLAVKNAGTGEAHKQLAWQYGADDPNVAFVNNEIRRLAQGRDQATDPQEKGRFQEFLNDLRVAISQVLAKFTKEKDGE